MVENIVVYAFCFNKRHNKKVLCNMNRESRKNIFLFDLKSPMIRASFFSQNLFKERREWIARGEGKTFQSILLFIKEKTFLLKRIVFNVKKHAQNWDFTDKKQSEN